MKILVEFIYKYKLVWNDHRLTTGFYGTIPSTYILLQ
jgi:hypothetical protein